MNRALTHRIALLYNDAVCTRSVFGPNCTKGGFCKPPEPQVAEVAANSTTQVGGGA